jgi:hypothetical protein
MEVLYSSVTNEPSDNTAEVLAGWEVTSKLRIYILYKKVEIEGLFIYLFIRL